MADPTPVPWAQYDGDPLVIVDDKGSSLGEMVPGDPYIDHDTALANAALVVQAVNQHNDLRALILDAYKGILVLKTMCRKAGLSGGTEASEQLLARMEAAMPELPALSALR